jgi:hypothetical protein
MTTYEYTVANTSSWNCAAQLVNRTADLQLATKAGRNITFDTWVPRTSPDMCVSVCAVNSNRSNTRSFVNQLAH